MNGRADVASSTADGTTSAVPGGNSGIGPASMRQWTRRSYLELGAMPRVRYRVPGFTLDW